MMNYCRKDDKGEFWCRAHIDGSPHLQRDCDHFEQHEKRVLGACKYTFSEPADIWCGCPEAKLALEMEEL